ncbi:hypothetical protein H6G41_27555 [Tolypothrix sp. FACHB-123]|uniref:GNAT family N-acetyltransferase n=1 Tax=Tolypothrix sp. FACHB-123 TaxID=2692868 RepID=UPI001688B402|nr:GNAT family N-acetyltransferase [Tolypothrix sp. FACHB-123]MBD2358322.1 hypothetical protein [Tolypothrix sp. FACHB-123]
MKIFSDRESFITKPNSANPFREFAVRATFSDFSEICQIFVFAVEYYKNKGIKQWDKDYDLGKIFHHINQGETYIVRNESGILLCTFTVSKLLPDYYPASLTKDDKMWLVKSLCTNLQQTSLIGRKVIPQIIKTAIQHQITQIYLDCVMANPALESLYQRYGFKRIAIVNHPKYNQDMAIMALNM